MLSTESETRYICLDLEHGGAPGTSLLQYAAIVLDRDLRELPGSQIDILVKPDSGQYLVEAAALAVNRIDLVEHDKVALSQSHACQRIVQHWRAWSQNGLQKLIPVGQGVVRDLLFLSQGKIISEAVWTQYVSYRGLDTGVLSRALQLAGVIPPYQSTSLVDMCRGMGLIVDDDARWHDALFDVRASAELVRWQIGQLRQIKPFTSKESA